MVKHIILGNCIHRSMALFSKLTVPEPTVQKYTKGFTDTGTVRRVAVSDQKHRETSMSVLDCKLLLNDSENHREYNWNNNREPMKECDI